MTTNFVSMLDKTTAGFHLLVLLSRACGHTPEKEKEVIRQFLEEDGGEKIDLIKEQAFLHALPQSEHRAHFEEICNRFYAVSTPEERYHIVDFAMKVVMADSNVTKEENKLIDILFNNWDMNR